MKIRFAIALVIGKICATLSRAFFPKRGSNLPGAIAIKLDPLFLRHVKGANPAKTIFITGTNGKSTATNMVCHVFETAGRTVCSNIEGANMKPGVATALIKNTSITGCLKTEYLVLEIDERSLATITNDLEPGHIAVTNIQKDQVQRNGDPDYIYQKIKYVIQKPKWNCLTLYLNNEEPRSKSLGRHIEGGGRVITYGVAKNTRETAMEPGWGTTMPCPLCHDALEFFHYNLAGVGAFSCPACGFASAERADCTIDEVDYEGGTFSIAGKCFTLAYPAAFFLYNYALCTCICVEMGIRAGSLKKAFETFTNVPGRMETFFHAGKRINYMRIKQENPETLQSALDTVAADRTEKVFVIGPAVVDDIVPHYTNTFYTFDCNFGALLASGVEQCICFGTTISFDMANRLRYAGFTDEKIEVLDTDDDAEILKAIAAVSSNNIYLITWIKKFETLKEHAK